MCECVSECLCSCECVPAFLCVRACVPVRASDLPSELSVMSVTVCPFCVLDVLPLLETESLASEPLSWSSWLSSGPGTFTRMVFCRRPLPTVLGTHRRPKLSLGFLSTRTLVVPQHSFKPLDGAHGEFPRNGQ